MTGLPRFAAPAALFLLAGVALAVTSPRAAPATRFRLFKDSWETAGSQ